LTIALYNLQHSTGML